MQSGVFASYSNSVSNGLTETEDVCGNWSEVAAALAPVCYLGLSHPVHWSIRPVRVHAPEHGLAHFCPDVAFVHDVATSLHTRVRANLVYRSCRADCR